ncbi:arsenic resistance N-acetyltransferase ArsN2 [Sphingomonas sp. ABOLG]|jgi:amino-acid N-acetyltransferase|uniref:arsenic resistance N-acetyltransferase ArsN2 n=1 Tax=Sphingomonas sp. ABOLG TaxID=1985880 RepID=UPI0019CFF399|nr:arsenic resistance N-acetyltransferase ArsN2 [Sphingomonas sp. ABOLG]
MTGVVVTPLRSGDLDEMATLLAAVKLPITDLGEPGRSFFRFDDAQGLIGYGGLEGEGADRLLRSVVVVTDRKGRGIDRAMIAALEQQARESGVQHLHLLTTTAASFFRSLGFADASRESVPATITASLEFTALCPASAAYLMKAL